MNKIYTSYLIIAFLVCGTLIYAQKKITILHTNDTHSRIEPIPITDKNAGNKGGVLRRFEFIEQTRKANKNVLLFDAGDFLQGTPYFNLFRGKVETEAMNLMRYDAATLGNHEFDYGLESISDILKWAKFPIISSNYDFENTILKNRLKPYIILKKNGLKIGVIGINVNPKGLIATDNYAGMKFLDPIETANKYASKLKLIDQCDMVICLSHLGYTADKKLANQSKNIDIIIGGHSHTYMKEPDFINNLDNQKVLIYQTAGRGIYVGKIDVELDKTKK